METVNIIVVGCGATGSNLVALLSQHMISTKMIRRLTLVDYDIIESKNFKNQKFTKKDIGKNKAEALANRYSKLGINIDFCDRKIECKEDLTSLIDKKENTIIVSCVDNMIARKHINNSFKNSINKGIIYIDSGNGTKDRNGQVVVCIKSNGTIHNSLDKFINIEEEIELEKKAKENLVDDFSCFDLSEHPQSFVTNVLAATTIFVIIDNILKTNPIKYYYQFDVDKSFMMGIDLD